MSSAIALPGRTARRPRSSRALARTTALLALLALAGGVGCGIGDSVANACITKERVYDRAQKRTTSLIAAGVPTDAPVHRAARQVLSDARAEYGACTALHSSRSI